MSHFAKIDENNIVQEVHVGTDENDLSGLPEGVSSWEEHYTNINPQGWTCKRTSYNTIGNEHNDSGTAFRGNYAGIGYTYDETNDVFIASKPYASWTMDESTWTWEAPEAYPDDGKDYIWNENKEEWEEVVE